MSDEGAIVRAMVAMVLPGHARWGDWLVTAPVCALWGCYAPGHTACAIAGGWSWLCDEHARAHLRGEALWPGVPC